MFGLFKKTKQIKTSPEEVNVIVQGVHTFVGAQLMLANKREQDLVGSKFTLGYLTGVCDAIAQRRGVPDEQHELVGMAVFAHLYPDKPEVYAAILKLGNDPEFFRGQMLGGQETMHILSKRITIGSGLTDYWKDQRPS